MMSLSIDDDVNDDDANLKSLDVESDDFFFCWLVGLNEPVAVVVTVVVISTAAELSVGGRLVRKRLNLEVVV